MRLHITYAITAIGAGATSTTTEENWVRRPFDGRREVRDVGADATEPLVTTYAFGRYRIAGAGSAPQVLAAPPSLAGNDLRLDVVMPEAIASGVLTRRERRVVLGRTCQVVRSPRSAGQGALEADPNDVGLMVDVCVDGRGVLLEEVTMRKGRTVRERIATSIEIDPPLADSLFAIEGTALPLAQGGGSVRPLEPTSRPPGAAFYELTGAAPAGFTLSGRFTVIPPQPAAYSDPNLGLTKQAGVADVYTRGPDLLVIERGATLGGQPAFAPDANASTVDLGPLGHGEAILGMGVNTVRVILPDGHFLRVAGTMPLDVLADVARHMEPQPAGELRFLDVP